ncbi:MAG: VOC family protein, partial [Nocardioidaceae bacterium]
FADGDLFDSTLVPGWSPMTASGLAQWGPPVTKDFLGLTPGRDAAHELMSMARSLRDHNEFDLTRLRGLLKVTNS